MSYRHFKTWLESKDIFGFEKNFGIADKKIIVDETPIDALDCEIILGELVKMPLGVKRPVWEWSDSIQWGTGETGTVKMYISPLGSYKAIIRRRLPDLEGNDVWICKGVIPFVETERDNISVEIAWAETLYEHVKRVDEQLVEMPSKNYKDLEKLTVSLANRLRTVAPPIFIFEGIRRMNDYNYIIHFSLRGQGVEAPTARRVEEFCINLNYRPETGLIRCWGNDVTSPTSGHTWELEPSEWDELFCPAQPRKEIEDAIINAFSTY